MSAKQSAVDAVRRMAAEEEYLVGRFYDTAPRGAHDVVVKSDLAGRWIECVDCGSMWEIYLDSQGRIAFDPVTSRECKV